MDSKSLVICDQESEYAARLAAFLNGKKELAFQVKIFKSPEQVSVLQKDESVDVMLVGSSFSIEERTLLKASKIFVLADEKKTELLPGETSIFKYQSGEEILSQIVQSFVKEEKAETFWYFSKKEKGKLIAVYSPVHRCGQTTFALKKGRELSRKENVLYLNLESFAGIDGYFPREDQRTLSTLLYYAKQENGQIGLILSTLVKKTGGLDYIPPAAVTEDLKLITSSEWKKIFAQILKESIYDILLLDLGECIQGIYEILEDCDEVYLPVADDKTAVSKLRQYEEVLYRLGYEELYGRMIKCDTSRTAAYEDS